MKSKDAKYRELVHQEVLEKYEEAKLLKKTYFSNPVEVLNVLGIDLYKIEGLGSLHQEEIDFIIQVIIKYLNGWGLEYRETIDPVKIEWTPNKNVYRLTFSDNRYIFINRNGTWY